MAAQPKPLHPRNIKKSGNSETIKKKIKGAFLHFYEKGGALYWAAKKAGRSADTIENWRKEDPAFDLAVLDARMRSVENLKRTGYLRAMKGTSKGADTLLMFFIKQSDPTFRENFGITASHLHGGIIANTSKVSPAVQAAVDAMSIEAVKRLYEEK